MPAAATMDDFEALLNESFELETPDEGTVVKGTVLGIEAGQAIIDIGYKMERRFLEVTRLFGMWSCQGNTQL